jgi:hypothetical protein
MDYLPKLNIFRFNHFSFEIANTSVSVNSQYSELLIIYIRTIVLYVTNFVVGGYPSNIKIGHLNITKLST